MENLDRQNNRNSQSSRKDSVDGEVQKLFRKANGKINQHDFQMLRNKYGNEELVEKIQRVFVEKHTEITKRAKKFAQLIREKYADTQYPFHILLEKAYKYKVKHSLSDDEFSEFQKIYENELVGIKSPEIFAPNTNITKLLGSTNIDFQGFNTKLSDTDYKILQDILKLHATSKPLHAQVIIQSMQYVDLAPEALSGKYDKVHHNVSNHVHPVIAALFLPKIDLLERHFLHSNIANIVRARYNNESFTSTADLELFWALTKDPNDIVCDNRSTIADLHTRSIVQNQLWNAVLSLRNGQYYNSSFREFITSIDVCRLNRQDTPDLVYGRYDGTVIKRLLSTFSFRPTVVATMPIYQVFTTNPYQQNIKPVVTYVPMINFKLPPSLTETDPVNLVDALEQQQFFLENGVIVPKHTSLIYSRQVLFFFVDRRATIVNTMASYNPFSIMNFPVTAVGFERLNEREVNFQDEILIRNDVYKLRSVVLSEVNKTTKENEAANIVVGSSAIIVRPIDYEKGIRETAHYLYDPYSVLTNEHDLQPIIRVHEAPKENDYGFNFVTMASRRGVIFMYHLVTDSTKGVLNL